MEPFEKIMWYIFQVHSHVHSSFPFCKGSYIMYQYTVFTSRVFEKMWGWSHSRKYIHEKKQMQELILIFHRNTH